jgi:hypothetical protein
VTPCDIAPPNTHPSPATTTPFRGSNIEVAFPQAGGEHNFNKLGVFDLPVNAASFRARHPVRSGEPIPLHPKVRIDFFSRAIGKVFFEGQILNVIHIVMFEQK